MIVASLLLILVAVTLLVLGLTGGSSGLLIGSIVASLLAAVALIIGARRNAVARAAGARGAAARGAAAGAMPGPAAPEFAAEATSPERGMDDFAPGGAVFAAESTESAQSDLSDKRETVQLEPVAYDDYDEVEPVPAVDEAYEAGRRDAVDGLTTPAAERESSDEPAWRQTEPVHAEPVHAEPVAVGDDFDAGPDGGDELDDADEEDPADEPLPQKVSPADAVRVARLNGEVLVVDGRPRYHVADCPHLVGKLTEPIPVNEAVELGFSPCGLCRPVDRLVAGAARR
ncbi:hypothetical protein ODJ79_07430 [Actinoplanes sp. KI2]|uniref:hypothetical protein n=1 Tax=Actinoplanes sp. KI2 TaxID=2983315 RepID=UPI0021D5B66D|nr:hypothetical protein [Actinoplanes sp. KI2]MCU7723539.1 hypothetical protein [Actinoplanes sp. KI2]